MLDNISQINILYDFYGELLPPRQKEIFRLYYEDNLSLAEIAEEYGLTRQGVHETVKRSEKKLRDYESKLKLINRSQWEEETIDRLRKTVEDMIREREADSQLVSKLRQIKDGIVSLNQ